MMHKIRPVSRRSFLQTSGAVAGAAALATNIGRTAWAGGTDLIKIALVGCGGRGRGAIGQIFNSDDNCKLVAMADAFHDKADSARKTLINHVEKQNAPEKMDVPDDRIFTGIDGYKKAIDAGVDLVVIATPPGFRPQQFEYAVDQGKHIFMEKPLAVDAVGTRRNMASNAKAKEKGLMVAIGLQRRHQPNYMETVKMLKDGAIGDIILQRVYWNGGGIWYRDGKKSEGEMPFQCDNWYHFCWVSGDQICEQHIHNLDIGLWVKGEHPVEANGMGGGELRMGGDRSKSQIFDHTFCEFTFADGTKMYSQGRHAGNTWTHVHEYAHGTKGTAEPAGKISYADGESWRFRGKGVSGHQQEQTDLMAALRRGEIYNEGDYGIESTFCAILGREACYSGKIIKWDELLEKGKDYAPGIDDYTMESTPPVVPGEDGKYPAPLPGQWNPFA